MKNILLATMSLWVMFKTCELATDKAEKEIKEAEYQPREEIVAFDWYENRGITKAMADTMVHADGRWFGKSNIPPHIKALKQKQTQRVIKEPKWIKPAGRDKLDITSKEGIAIWRIQNEQEQIQLDEARMEEIAIEILDRR